MKIFYTDHFVLPLPPEHRFPMLKYAQLRQRVVQSHLFSPDDLLIPPPATDEELSRVHTWDYIQRVQHGQLTRPEIRQLGFPWSPEMVERSRRSVGATIAACRVALSDGLAANLAGGTHHAFSHQPQGYCVFNDSAVAARAMQAEGRIQRVIIIDADVHQGNGTAAIFAQDPSVFTFSIHGEKNFPFRKEISDLDVALADGTTDAAYLTALEQGLATSLRRAQADLAIYLAGADPYLGDRLGRLALTKAGLAARDRLVFDYCQAARLPVAIAMAGGYAPNISDIVDIHFETLKIAVECAKEL